MPLRGQGHSNLVKDEAPYFDSLAELDTWLARPHYKLDGVLPYLPRPHADGQSETRGKLLVCHDYKGGYNEPISELSYTFNFMRLCDTFVYFSHHRVTVPPSGYTNAAHKQGTRMLGTLIFENSTDCLQLVVGHQGSVITDNNIPVSKRYAILLAELAYQRGFDGYLLNVEANLQHHTNHARALASWMLLLRAELRAKVGPHAQVVWYDSVKYDGTVQYQNRLNGYNLPFFLASDAFFTNYWWEPETQRSMFEYLTRLHQHSSSGDETSSTKALQSIYAGVDVWPGRGQYGDSGYNCYRALTYTTPLGFSAAVFAPGWTWESATTNSERNWTTWCENERKLWLGPLVPGGTIDVPESPESPFRPITAFFQDLPPPDPARCAFYTHFSPGAGYSWFVEGRKVLETQNGWFDIDKQTSIGNLVWPWPSLQGDLPNGAAVSALSAIDPTDGYNGGTMLKLNFTYKASRSDEAAQNLWMPVQSLTLTTGTPFEARIVHKTTEEGKGAIIVPQIDVRALYEQGSDDDVRLTVGSAVVVDLQRGWTQQTIAFTPTSTRPSVSVAVGLRLGIAPSLPTATFALSLGYLAVYPAPPPPSVSVGTSSVTAANFAPARAGSHEGVLTWDTASTFSPIDVRVEDAESITPAWLLKDTPAYRFPTFVYFNVYAAPLTSGGGGTPEDAVFIGTTGLDGRANRFYVDPACLPAEWDQHAGARFFIQGVTDRGEVLPWKSCATVDHPAASTAA